MVESLHSKRWAHFLYGCGVSDTALSEGVADPQQASDNEMATLSAVPLWRVTPGGRERGIKWLTEDLECPVTSL